MPKRIPRLTKSDVADFALLWAEARHTGQLKGRVVTEKDLGSVL